MNHKLIISRVALSSALLLSTVAGPAISNAASTKPAEIQAAQKKASHPFADLTKTISVVDSFTNPLDVAKKYAPDTLEDWTKTLDRYEKTVGKNLTAAYSIVEAAPVASTDAGKAEKIKLSSASASSAKELNISEAEIEISSLNASDASVTLTKSSKPIASKEALMATAVAIEDNDADLTFIKAEIKLAQAIQTENSATIKHALSELLEQYKQQIKEWEAAE
ncbi:hypothetical protein [Paenibacillus spongiae]|uniref:Uncharacterized protein n=1 Tax=Paenibacillus spongiae TaxID=2909671 RepID=A0ABY5SDS9_9BACL|nr:hypothetical protein [Paenibacillus spongiae]UVI30660.1 hypothetical protein L1F29_01920 [Paenibacillus spongiae]